jgi:hypothetical protein
MTGMQLYIRTRGQARMVDYQFLGKAPEDAWWRPYGSVSILGDPTILLESDGRSWRLYISGIATQRRDATGTRLQFDLVLGGDCDVACSADHELSLGIIATSLAGLAARPLELIPGDQLDAQFGPSEIEKMLSTPGENTYAQAASAVRAAYLGTSASVGGPTRLSSRRRWLGGLGSGDSRRLFISVAGRLLAGNPGRVLMLNLITTEQDAERIPGQGGELGVLASHPGPLFEAGVRPLKIRMPSGRRDSRPWFARLLRWLGGALRARPQSR